jgi:pimeloyl-ACP methyl ester carboxylesterase
MSKSLELWAQERRSMVYGGVETSFKIGGSGPKLLLIPGTPFGAYDWHVAWPHLCDCFRVLVPDLPGSGLSGRRPKQRSISATEQADFLEQLVANEGWSSFHVVAHGLGVHAALELMLRDMQRQRPLVQAAVLLNGPAFAEAWQPHLRDHMSLTRAGRLLRLTRGKASFERSVRAMFGSVSPPTEELLADFFELAGPEGIDRYRGQAAQFMAALRQRPDALTAPMLDGKLPIRFVSGEADLRMGRAMAQRYKELCPGADVVRLAEVGHWPQLEVPRLVVGYIAQKLLYIRRQHAVSGALAKP